MGVMHVTNALGVNATGKEDQHNLGESYRRYKAVSHDGSYRVTTGSVKNGSLHKEGEVEDERC